MSISIQPANQSLAQATKFRLTFERLPELTFFCIGANIPGLSFSTSLQPTPFSDAHVPGDKIQYEDLVISFLIDEDYKSWTSIHDWIRSATFPKTYQEYREAKINQPPNLQKTRLREINGVNDRASVTMGKPQYSDAALTVYTNKNNPNVRFKIFDCFPYELDGIDLDTQVDAHKIITGTAKFKFWGYDIDRL